MAASSWVRFRNSPGTRCFRRGTSSDLPATPSVTAGLVTMLSGEPVRWRDHDLTRPNFSRFAIAKIYGACCFRASPPRCAEDWPTGVRDELAQRARDDTAREMLRREEMRRCSARSRRRRVADRDERDGARLHGVRHPRRAPPSRHRSVDQIRAPGHRAPGTRARATRAPVVLRRSSFSQFEMEKTDEFGVRHVIDVHWKISTQPVFADVLMYKRRGAVSRGSCSCARPCRRCAVCGRRVAPRVYPIRSCITRMPSAFCGPMTRICLRRA